MTDLGCSPVHTPSRPVPTGPAWLRCTWRCWPLPSSPSCPWLPCWWWLKTLHRKQLLWHPKTVSLCTLPRRVCTGRGMGVEIAFKKVVFRGEERQTYPNKQSPVKAGSGRDKRVRLCSRIKIMCTRANNAHPAHSGRLLPCSNVGGILIAKWLMPIAKQCNGPRPPHPAPGPQTRRRHHTSRGGWPSRITCIAMPLEDDKLGQPAPKPAVAASTSRYSTRQRLAPICSSMPPSPPP